jgi:hypothetical protein
VRWEASSFLREAASCASPVDLLLPLVFQSPVVIAERAHAQLDHAYHSSGSEKEGTSALQALTAMLGSDESAATLSTTGACCQQW